MSDNHEKLTLAFYKRIYGEPKDRLEVEPAPRVEAAKQRASEALAALEMAEVCIIEDAQAKASAKETQATQADESSESAASEAGETRGTPEGTEGDSGSTERHTQQQKRKQPAKRGTKGETQENQQDEDGAPTGT
ncbi:hypothetical protein QWY84_16855 [Aquisalimonas lutea]|uniref:hypothetical protein n=1 Tax=Aquisalimonas lutea TaxID=1327750 RepID=UPI0025B6162F|nr:hypothetical protein [Aquisalimonas lutea]MDN3519285.1 hypothetical protein [Aquisalimonas lutea]